MNLWANSENRIFNAQTAMCEICESPISRSEFLRQPIRGGMVCRALNCRRIIKQKEGNLSAFKIQVRAYRRTVEIRNAKRAHIEEVEKRENLENQLVLKSILDSQLGTLKRPLHVVNVPTARSKMCRVSEERVAAYKANLTSIIKEVYSDESLEENVNLETIEVEEVEASTDEVFEPSSLTLLREQMCGICKGGCCSRGEDHAYIAKATIARVKKLLPLYSPEDILDKYMACVADQTVEGACINQTQTGCGLPRTLRSDICNNFFCPELRNLEDEVDISHSPNSVLVVKRSNDMWKRFDQGSENEITEVWIAQDDSVHPVQIETAD